MLYSRSRVQPPFEHFFSSSIYLSLPPTLHVTYELVTYLLVLVVLPGFLVQFGISYSVDKELKKFARQTIPDDPHRPDLRQVNNMSVCVCVS